MLCALPIECLVETMRPLPIEQVAGAPPYVRGVSIIRGVPVPVVDIGLIVGGGLTDSARLVTLRVAGRTIALAVDAVVGVTAIAADAFGQLPPLLQNAATDTIAAIGAIDEKFLVLLRAGRIVPDDVLARFDNAEATS